MRHAVIVTLSLLFAVLVSFVALILLGEISPEMQYETALPYLIGLFVVVFGLSIFFMEKKLSR
ncbi:MAG: hypothetical protein HEQ39_14180 [Rhizobacter sp.]